MINFRVDPDRCTRCGECARDCPMGIISLENDLPSIATDREPACIQCQHCLAVCPTAALSILGRDPDQSRPLKNALPSQEQMETLIMGRRSVRHYDKKPVVKKVIAHMLDVLGHAPTGRNNKGLLLTVVDDAAAMHKLRNLTMHGIRLAVQAGTLPKHLDFFSAFLGAWDKGRDIIFRDAPHMLVASTPADGPSPEADCLISLSYFELLAQSMGLGTVWCGLAKWGMEIVPEIRIALGIPEEHLLGYVMMFGNPAVRYHRTVQRGPVNLRRYAP